MPVTRRTVVEPRAIPCIVISVPRLPNKSLPLVATIVCVVVIAPITSEPGVSESVPDGPIVIVCTPVFNDPEETERIPLTVGSEFSATPFELLIVKLFNDETPEGIITPDELPPNANEDDRVVERFAGVPAMAGPLRESVLDPTDNTPLERVNVPDTVQLTFNVTPPEVLLTVRSLKVVATLPPIVSADPPLSDIKPPLWINDPLLLKFPPMANVPDGAVTVPFDMVKLLPVVAGFEPNDHAPFMPLNVRTLNALEPVIDPLRECPVVVAVNVTMLDPEVKVAEFVQFP